LADGGKTVDPLIIIGKIEGCDVGLGLVRACQPAKLAASQEVQTSLPRKLFNVHCVSPGILRNLACRAELILRQINNLIVEIKIAAKTPILARPNFGCVVGQATGNYLKTVRMRVQLAHRFR
jgi:hypothetical protein